MSKVWPLAVVVFLTSMAVTMLLNTRSRLREMEHRIVSDSIYRVLLDSASEASRRWRNRCYLIAMESGLNPERECDDRH